MYFTSAFSSSPVASMVSLTKPVVTVISSATMFPMTVSMKFMMYSKTLTSFLLPVWRRAAGTVYVVDRVNESSPAQGYTDHSSFHVEKPPITTGSLTRAFSAEGTATRGLVMVKIIVLVCVYVDTELDRVGEAPGAGEPGFPLHTYGHREHRRGLCEQVA